MATRKDTMAQWRGEQWRWKERGKRAGRGDHNDNNSIDVDGGVTMRWRRRPIAVAADASNATINKVDARVMEEQGNEVREGGGARGGGKQEQGQIIALALLSLKSNNQPSRGATTLHGRRRLRRWQQREWCVGRCRHSHHKEEGSWGQMSVFRGGKKEVPK